jgi:monoterpene epsilon-lactone hydrolase
MLGKDFLAQAAAPIAEALERIFPAFLQRQIYVPRGIAVFNLAPFYRIILRPEAGVEFARDWLDSVAPIQPLPAGTVAEKITLGGRPAERITVGATVRPRAVLYLHGGGYTLGSIATHRSLAAHLAQQSGAVVFLLDYRLAPEHPYPAALEDTVAAYLDIINNHGFTPEQVGIGGDSAGGGLTAAAARLLIDEHDMTPGALAMLSPLTDPKDETLPPSRDLMISQEWLHHSADQYLGDGDAKAPGFAPMHAQLVGLPATLVHVGLEEILRPQVRRFVEKALAAGVEVTYTELKHLWHAGHTQAGVVREAAEAVQAVGEFLRHQLDEAVEVARVQALALAAEAREQAQHAAAEALLQAQQVAAEARDQVQHLNLGQARRRNI